MHMGDMQHEYSQNAKNSSIIQATLRCGLLAAHNYNHW